MIVAIWRSVPVVLLCAALVALAAPPAQGQARWQASYTEPYGVLVLRNAGGRTTVTSGNGGAIEIAAQRADGSALAADSVTVDKTAPGVLSLRVPDGAPLTQLEVSAPAHTHISIQGGAGTVVVQGAFGGLAVETDAGSIVVQLPPAADADVTFTTSGEIVSTLPLTPTAGNALPSGRLGGGGPRYDLRSASGKIFLLPFGGESPAPPMQAAAQENETEQPAARLPAPGPAEERRLRSSALRPASARGNSEAGISVVSQMVLANVAVGAPPAEQNTGLTAADFAVLDEGKPQQIAYFAPVEEPLDLILLLDLSGSTKSKFNLIKKAAERFVAALSLQDRVAVCAFTTNFMVVSEFTADRKLLSERIRSMKHREGGTRFYRAMWLSLDMMAKVKGNRKAIVVMTDGVDNALQTGANSGLSPRVAELLEALRAARRTGGNPQRQAAQPETDFEALLHRISGDGVSIFPVYINTEYEIVVRRGDGDSMQYQEAREQLEAIAAVVGTTVFKADRIEDLDGAYARVATELHNLYTVGFYPTDAKEAGAWHDIAINVSRAGFTARTRRGYYVD